jgi:hypothetical protein
MLKKEMNSGKKLRYVVAGRRLCCFSKDTEVCCSGSNPRIPIAIVMETLLKMEINFIFFVNLPLYLNTTNNLFIIHEGL